MKAKLPRRSIILCILQSKLSSYQLHRFRKMITKFSGRGMKGIQDSSSIFKVFLLQRHCYVEGDVSAYESALDGHIPSDVLLVVLFFTCSSLSVD